MDAQKIVAIAGAGAAGLAAALEILDGGAVPILIEARTRPGGRAWTEDFPGGSLYAEIGPEFIHGLPDATLSLLERYGISRYDVGGESRAFRDGKLIVEDADDETAEQYFFSALAACPADTDPTVAELFTRIPPPDRNAEFEREIFRMTNGFDAADPAIAGARALADEWRGDASLGGDASKPLGGYRTLMRAAAHEITMRGGTIRFAERVRAIDSRPDGCTVHTQRADGQTAAIDANAIIVTIPLPLLVQSFVQAAWSADDADVRIASNVRMPEPMRAALERRAMGHVVKPVLRFSEAFWEHLHDGEYRATSFFRSAPNSPFPVMWTTMPFHTPLLTFWAGGTDANAALFSEDSLSASTLLTDVNHPVLRAAFQTISATFDFDARPLFRDAVYVDWQRDPLACGAYSFAKPFGQNDRQLLAEPIAPGIYLAGEAFAPAGQTGTVAGAMLSGRAAAQGAL